MRKLIICKGLPGSGKSTWASQQPAATVVNKDEIRDSLGEPWSRVLEQKVIQLRNNLIKDAFKGGAQIVISDDTNISRKHEASLRQLATQLAASFEIKSFLDVPIETCIERDSKREGKAKVGEKVIRDMWDQYIQSLGKVHPAQNVSQLKIEPYPFDIASNLPICIICDLDGTLALHEGLRGPYEHEKAEHDNVNRSVSVVLNSLRMSGLYKIIFMSGREEKFRPQTESFLARVGFLHFPLYMRTTGDMRNDTIVKYELFNSQIRGNYRVLFCLDDRDRIVKLWRDMGLSCFQVNDGNF